MEGSFGGIDEIVQRAIEILRDREQMRYDDVSEVLEFLKYLDILPSVDKRFFDQLLLAYDVSCGRPEPYEASEEDDGDDRLDVSMHEYDLSCGSFEPSEASEEDDGEDRLDGGMWGQMFYPHTNIRIQ